MAPPSYSRQLCRRLLQQRRLWWSTTGDSAARPTITLHRTPTTISRSVATQASNNATADAQTSAITNSNSNPNEVDKFSSFASNWWDSRSNPLVGMNPIRIKFMRDVTSHFQPECTDSSSNNNDSNQLPLHNRRILDIGCGGGLLTESLSRLGASLVVGVDASPKVVEVAKMHSSHNNSRLSSEQLENNVTNSNSNNRTIRYIGGKTVEELALHWQSEREKEQSTASNDCNNEQQPHELFDIITALEVIEHVPNPTSLLQAASSLLKPNGILFVSTINRTMKSYGLAIVAAEYISGKVPVGTHNWNQFWSPMEVEQMVYGSSGTGSNNIDNRSRMKQIALSGMVIEPPFVNLQWRLDPKDVDVNWIGAYQKQT